MDFYSLYVKQLRKLNKVRSFRTKTESTLNPLRILAGSGGGFAIDGCATKGKGRDRNVDVIVAL